MPLCGTQINSPPNTLTRLTLEQFCYAYTKLKQLVKNAKKLKSSEAYALKLLLHILWLM